MSFLFLCFAFHISWCLRRKKHFKETQLNDFIKIIYSTLLTARGSRQVFAETKKHCLLKCVKNQECFSTNIGVDSGKVLLSSDKYRSSGNFRQSSVFHHYSIPVSWSFYNFDRDYTEFIKNF